MTKLELLEHDMKHNNEILSELEKTYYDKLKVLNDFKDAFKRDVDVLDILIDLDTTIFERRNEIARINKLIKEEVKTNDKNN